MLAIVHLKHAVHICMRISGRLSEASQDSRLYIKADSVFLLSYSAALWPFDLSLQMHRYSYTASYIIYNIYTRWAGVADFFSSLFYVHGWFRRWLLIYICVHQGGLGAEPSGGSERGAPTRSVGTTGTAAGKSSFSPHFLLSVHATLPLRRGLIRWSALMWCGLHCLHTCWAVSVWLFCHWPNSNFHITLDSWSLSCSSAGV